MTRQSTVTPGEWVGPWCSCNHPRRRHPLGHEGFCARRGVGPGLRRAWARLVAAWLRRFR